MKKALTLVIVLSVLLSGTLNLVVVESQTASTWSLPYGNQFIMRYDGSRYLWLASAGGNEGCLLRIDTDTISINVTNAVSSYKIAPTYNPIPSAIGCVLGVAIEGTNIWASACYSGSDKNGLDLLAKLDTLTGNVTHYWLPVRSIRGIEYDPFENCIWVGSAVWNETKLAGCLGRFDIATENFKVEKKLDRSVIDLIVEEDRIWMAADSVRVYNKTSGELTSIEGELVNLLAKDLSGNIWYSLNNQHKVVKVGGPSYSVPVEEDGPYGLVFDNTGMMWIAGYSSKVIYQMNPSSGQILKSVAVSHRPYYLVKDTDGDIWCDGYGSISMILQEDVIEALKRQVQMQQYLIYTITIILIILVALTLYLLRKL